MPDRPPDPTAAAALRTLREEAAACRACPLWERATQTVFGEGSVRAELMLVGEQPGDREDVEGRPFVGPAGRLLGAVLEEAGIDRDLVYVTNAVKHFKWKPGGGGKRRIHDKPGWTEIGACRPWLEAELALVRPRVVVCLGATAAQTLLGRSARVGELRGRPLGSEVAETVVVTVHPSAVLRSQDETSRREARRAFAADVAVAAAALRGPGGV